MTTIQSSESFTVIRDQDVVPFRNRVKDAAVKIGMSILNQTKLITAASELARNLLKYGGGGSVLIETVMMGRDTGIRLIFSDKGPGISDLSQVMQDGYSTGNSLGLGLPGTKRLVNVFDIRSKVGEGTVVTIIKWKNG